MVNLANATASAQQILSLTADRCGAVEDRDRWQARAERAEALIKAAA